MTSARLDKELGIEVFFKCENLQKVGAFKARGATNAVMSLDDECGRARCHHALVGEPRRRVGLRRRGARYPMRRGDARGRAGNQGRRGEVVTGRRSSRAHALNARQYAVRKSTSAG